VDRSGTLGESQKRRRKPRRGGTGLMNVAHNFFEYTTTTPPHENAATEWYKEWRGEPQVLKPAALSLNDLFAGRHFYFFANPSPRPELFQARDLNQYTAEFKHE
jgi:hypothetical protein